MSCHSLCFLSCRCWDNFFLGKGDYFGTAERGEGEEDETSVTTVMVTMS